MRKLLLLLPMLMMACTTPETPAQTVYLAQSNYATALRIELAYGNLPRCGKAWSPKVCSDVKILKKVQTADNIAWSALKQAQHAVRTPGYGDSKVTTTVASAKALTNAFVEITAELEIK